MELVVNDGAQSVPQAWVDRWTLLRDYQEDNGNKMIWDLTSEEELQQWVTLNKYMDENRTIYNHFGGLNVLPSRVYRRRIPASSVLTIVRYMNAIDGEYLLSVDIDEELPFNERKAMYEELGRHIRKNNMNFFYRADQEVYGSHLNLGLWLDPVISADESEVELALLFPYNILIGILHTAAVQQERQEKISGLIEDDRGIVLPVTEYLSEVAWWLIRWNDIRDMYLTQETMNRRDYAISVLDDRIYQLEQQEDEDVSYATMRSKIDTTQGEVSEVPDIVRIFLGLPLLYPLDLHILYDPDVSPQYLDGIQTELLWANQKTRAFSHPPKMMSETPLFLSLLVNQVDIVDPVLLPGLASYVFGIDRFFTEDVIPKYREETHFTESATDSIDAYGLRQMDATSTIAVWMNEELNRQYAGSIPTMIYPSLVSRLLSVTNKDFVLAIARLCDRLVELHISQSEQDDTNNTDNNMPWDRSLVESLSYSVRSVVQNE